MHVSKLGKLTNKQGVLN